MSEHRAGGQGGWLGWAAFPIRLCPSGGATVPSAGCAGLGQPWLRVLLHPETPAQPCPCSPRYGAGSFSFSRLILAVTQRFSTEYELQQVRLDPDRVCGTGHQAPQPQQEQGHGSALPAPGNLPLASSPWEGAPAPAPHVPRGPGSFCPCPGLLGAARAPHTCSSPSSPWQLEQFKADNEDIGFGSGTRALEQALERTRTNINWVKENQATVLAWFESATATTRS